MIRGVRNASRIAAMLLPLGLVACQALIKSPAPCEEGFGPDGCPHKICDPKVLEKPTVHAAASDLDHLEKHIDWHGSVVPKVPDVWGQARLTVYREQFEQQMQFELNRFDETLQGSIARSDQAFLLNATALSASLQTPLRGPQRLNLPAGPYLRRDTNGNLTDPTKADNYFTMEKDVTVLVPSLQATLPVPAQKDKDGNDIPGVPASPALPRTFPALGVVAGGPGAASVDGASVDFFVDRATGLTFKNKFVNRNNDVIPLTLEPERYLEQKKRYLDLLAQIRRANEGDDTADSPGYSLQLFRIPVSVLPGKHTDRGHGAEITMTLTPVLGDDLLPTTFRGLVINDLVDQLGFPLTKFLDDKAARELLTKENRWIVRHLDLFDDIAKADPTTLDEYFVKIPAEVLELMLSNVPKEEVSLKELLEKYVKIKNTTAEEEATKKQFQDATREYAQKATEAKRHDIAMKNLRSVGVGANSNITRAFGSLVGLKTPFSPGTRNRQAMPSSQYLEVYGAAFAFEIAFKANQALGKQIDARNYAHLPDVQAFLKQELDAAYQMLAQEGNHDLLDHFCTSYLVNLVRTRQQAELFKQREVYRGLLRDRTDRKRSEEYDIGELDKDPKFSTTAALGWTLIVDSALLTDRFIADMKATASTRGATLPQCGVWLDYYRPCPSPDARAAFNAYVRARWPIHVFALDPAIEEQNLADRLATRHELQLALSLAFSHGFMNFNQLTRYARRLEAEYETIDVNRTQIGFAHGSDTFGWRFYPRYQTPDTPSNLTLIARDLIIGGPNKNQLLRQRRLEPGPRECVALIIMPSFVPAVQLDTTSNFFGLANPKHKVFDHTQAVKLGRTVQAIKNVGCGGLTDANCYREGDAARLVKRAGQLEARLPLQTVTFPVPTEDGVGGFELFSNNTTDLAPELYGFYGAPGISAKETRNHLFLVGDHFSPLRTRVIVGNQGLVKDGIISNDPPAPTLTIPSTSEAPPAGTTEVKKMVLLSRQVMQIEIPTGLLPLYDKETNRYYYTVHVATPYGVSRELLVPAICPPNVCPEQAPPPRPVTEGYTFSADTLTLPYCKSFLGMDGKYRLGLVELPKTTALRIKWDDALSVAPQMITNVTFDFEYDGCPFSIPLTGNILERDKGYSLTETQLKELQTELLRYFNRYSSFTSETDPLMKGLKVKAVKLTPVDPNRAVATTTVAGDLTLKFTCSDCGDKAIIPGKEEPKPKLLPNVIEGANGAPVPLMPSPLAPAAPSASSQPVPLQLPRAPVLPPLKP